MSLRAWLMSLSVLDADADGAWGHDGFAALEQEEAGGGRGRGGRRSRGRGDGGAGRGRTYASAASMIVRSVVVPTREARVVETTRVIDTSPTKRNDLGPVQSRLGGKQSLSTGTVLRVTNLASTVSGEDMKDLFEATGPLKKVVKKKGMCEITFQKKTDAMRAIKEYNGVLLDDVPMKVQLVKPKSETSFTVTI